MFKIFLYLFLYLHCMGCLWAGIVNQNQDNFKEFYNQDGFVDTNRSMQWYPPLEMVNFPDTKYFVLGKQGHNLSKMIYSFYYSVLFLGVNDIMPVNKIEIFTCLMLFVGAIIVSSIQLSEIAVLISSIQRKRVLF